MSGNQILLSFFTDQVNQAELLVELASKEFRAAITEQDSKEAKDKLARANVYLLVIKAIKSLFETNHLTEKRLKEALQMLREDDHG